MAAEASDFFVDVELVRHDAGFLQQAHVVDFGVLHERIDAFTELDLPRFNTLRVEHFDLVECRVQVIDSLFQVGGEVRAFLFAHGNHAVERLVQFRLQVLFPGFVVGACVRKLQNLGDRKHVFELDFAGNAVLGLHGLRDFDEFGDGGLVVADGDVPNVAFAEGDAHVHRAAGKLFLDLGLEIVFQVREVLGNLTRNLEESAVHAAHFDNAADSVQCGFALAESGHRNNRHASNYNKKKNRTYLQCFFSAEIYSLA